MTESGWLIECYDKGPKDEPLYFRLLADSTEKPRAIWVEWPDAALRFARESDAAWIARLYPEMCCLARISEHLWIDGKLEVSGVAK